MQREDRFAAKPSSTTLICLRGIGKAIAEDPCPALKRRQYVLPYLLGTRGEHQSNFGKWSESAGSRVEYDCPYSIANRSAPWLSRSYHVKVFLLEHLRETLHLGAFAAPVKTFEGDELTAFAGSHNVILASGKKRKD
jgi:hypothetical protein